MGINPLSMLDARFRMWHRKYCAPSRPPAANTGGTGIKALSIGGLTARLTHCRQHARLPQRRQVPATGAK
ncbi:MAG: hypothetical protein RLZZ511_2234 [Cyanobacteriota bacterium]|jgi:hypothetical protein